MQTSGRCRGGMGWTVAIGVDGLVPRGVPGISDRFIVVAASSTNVWREGNVTHGAKHVVNGVITEEFNEDSPVMRVIDAKGIGAGCAIGVEQREEVAGTKAAALSNASPPRARPDTVK